MVALSVLPAAPWLTRTFLTISASSSTRALVLTSSVLKKLFSSLIPDGATDREALQRWPPVSIVPSRNLPHDFLAFTQWAILLDGVLVESTGLRGHSPLRLIDAFTGLVLSSAYLPTDLFAEGISHLEFQEAREDDFSRQCSREGLGEGRREVPVSSKKSPSPIRSVPQNARAEEPWPGGPGRCSPATYASMRISEVTGPCR